MDLEEFAEGWMGLDVFRGVVRGLEGFAGGLRCLDMFRGV